MAYPVASRRERARINKKWARAERIARKYVKSKAKRAPMRRRRLHGIKPTLISSSNGRSTQSQTVLAAKRITPEVKAITATGTSNYFLSSTSQAALEAPIGYQNLYSFAYMDKSNLLSIGGSQGGTSPLPFRYVLESAVNELRLNNANNCMMEVELYDVVLKRDLPTTNSITTGASVGGFTYACQGIFGATDYVNFGTNAASGVGATILPYRSQQLGSKPWDSLFFKDYFKIIRRVELKLAAGQQHTHTVVQRPHRLIDNTKFNAASQGIAGITCYTLVYFRGQVGSQVGEAGLKCSTAPVLLTTVQTARVKYTSAGDAYSNITSYNSVPNTGNVVVFNVGSGAIEQAQDVD